MEKLIITKTYNEDFNTYDYQLIYGSNFRIIKEAMWGGSDEHAKRSLLQVAKREFETFTLNDVVIVDRSV